MGHLKMGHPTMLNDSLREIVGESEASPVEDSDSELSNFPDENPNPVMRLSRQGHLLYANRASAPLLNTWQQQAGGNIQTHIWESASRLSTVGYRL